MSHRELWSDIRDGPLFCISKPATWCWCSARRKLTVICSERPKRLGRPVHCCSPSLFSLSLSLPLSLSLSRCHSVSFPSLLSLFHSVSLSSSLCLCTVNPELVVYKTRLAVACTLQRQTSWTERSFDLKRWWRWRSWVLLTRPLKWSHGGRKEKRGPEEKDREKYTIKKPH